MHDHILKRTNNPHPTTPTFSETIEDEIVRKFAKRFAEELDKEIAIDLLFGNKPGLGNFRWRI
jgi:hypothetical protein